MSDPMFRLPLMPAGAFPKADMSARSESFRTEAKIDALRVPPQSVEAEQAVIGGLIFATTATLLLQRMGLTLDPLLEQSDAVLSQLIERYQKNR